MTYLEVVNKVLLRLREKEVQSVSSTPYSLLIGDLVNDVKDEIESAWNWNALRTTFRVNTTANIINYALLEAVHGSRLLNAWNDTAKIELKQMSTHDAEEKFLTSRTPGTPDSFNFNGADRYGNLLVDVWPIPDGVHALTFNMIVPQGTLTSDTEDIKIPIRPLIEGSVARAIRERGEDGGLEPTYAEMRYERSLADALAHDAALHPDEVDWYAE
jgi:hypothetical protein